MFNTIGSNGIYRIFALTNLLVGDPVIELAIPPKTNLTSTVSDIYLMEQFPNESMDSLGIVIKFFNLGMAPIHTFLIRVINDYTGNIIFSDSVTTIIPEFEDSLVVYIPIKSKSGLHSLQVALDYLNQIDELDEDDNVVNFTYNVSSVSLKPIVYDKNFSKVFSEISFLNHTYPLNLNSPKIFTEIDTTSDFSSPSIVETPLDTFYTGINLSGLTNGKRYWLRSKLDYPEGEWNDKISFIKSDENSNFYLNDEFSFSQQNLLNLTNRDGIRLSIDTFFLRVESGGGDVTKYGAVLINGINVLPNTFSWGMGIAVFDSVTLNVDTAQTYYYGSNLPVANELAGLIHSIPQGKIVAMNVIDDGSSNLTDSLKTAIKTLGSTKVDSITFRRPWVLIGRKGAAPGDVIEIIKPRTYPDILSADTSYIRFRTIGNLTTSLIGPSARWRTLNISESLPFDSGIKYKITGINISGTMDTLGYAAINNNSADLSFIDASVYPFIRVSAEFNAAQNGESPALFSEEVIYTGVPELGTNFQGNGIYKDTIDHNEPLDFYFNIFNAGESDADSFSINIELMKADNTKRLLTDTLIQLPSSGNKLFNYIFNRTQDDGYGNMAILITIDPSDNILELYEDNNVFSLPFFVREDTTIVSVTPATLSVTFDGSEIIDGDYVSSSPKIEMVLSYPSWFPVNDTSAVEFFLNQQRIAYSQLEINYDTVNKRIIYNYSPVLSDGEYELRVYGKNIFGNLEDTPGYEKTFLVTNEAHITEVYNYPNPFNTITYFTFYLTQIPSEVRIKIYTVAGRLIKEIQIPSFKMNFNTFSWDGKDEDGDLIANGVYLYKVIMKHNGKSESVTQKLAVVR
jgi:hypothetical protein